MRVLEHSQLSLREFERSVLTIGNFDGVHRGHQELLRRVERRGRELGASSVVYTFHPHPLQVLNPSACPPMISSFEDRVTLVDAQGIEALVWARFDREYAVQEPEAFVREVLAGRLGAVEIWVGPDFAFGRGRSGSFDLLRRMGEASGFTVEVLPPFTYHGEVVSSTRIRAAVARADFETPERLLGRPYTFHGPVVHGAGRGRGLGFPTANILPREECLPPPGVYAAWAAVAGATRPCAVNIGPNPTFAQTETTIESYLLDFEGDLYAEELRVQPVQLIRGEIAFRRAEDLAQQIERDVEEIRRALGLRRHRAIGGP